MQRGAARALGRQNVPVSARSQRDFNAAFAAMAEQHVGAALVASDPILLSERAIAELSAHHARSMHALVKEKPGRKPFRTINTMKDDPAGVERMSEEIKTRYAQLFKV